jgi:hypothetical protein
LKAGIEPLVAALAAPIEGRRYDDDELGHRPRTLRMGAIGASLSEELRRGGVSRL